MGFLDQTSAKDAVYTRTKQYKEIPTITLRSSTYKQVFNKLNSYDTAKQNNNTIEIISALTSLRAALENWMIKPAHVQEFVTPESSSTKIKVVFAELQTEVDTNLRHYVGNDDFKIMVGADIANKLATQLTDGAGYSAVSNPLLVFVLERLVQLNKPAGLTRANFRQEVVNYIIADNDVRGSASFLLQALGDKKSISFSIDFGKLILPFLTLSLDLGAAKSTTSNSALLFECLSKDFNENADDLRYGFYRMFGWTREYLAEVGITAGVGVSIGGSSDESLIGVELEVAGINAMPSLETPGASASVKAHAKGSYTWTVMQVADLAPRYFTSMTTDETVDLVMTRITEPVPKEVAFNNKIGAVLNIYSNAYGGDVGVSASAKGGAGPVSGEIDLSGNAIADMRSSTIVLQTPARSLGNQKKTQITQLWLKQIGVKAKAKASGSVLGNEAASTQSETAYDFVNSFSYSTVTAYWTAKEAAQARYALEPRSGYSRGQSLIAKGLEERMANIENEDKYFSAIANQLGLHLGAVKAFFSANQKAIKDVLATLQYYVNKNEMPESVLSSLVVEATFAPKTGPSPGFTLNPSTSMPNDDIKEVLTNMNNLYLQSIRFRIPRMDRKYVEKPGFKLGLNIKIIKFGVDLGMIEDASTLAMTDIVISWFSSGGVELEGTSEPDDYVPATVLIM